MYIEQLNNLTRSEYYRQLDQASRKGGGMSEFIAYAAQGLVDQLREQLTFIRNLQWDTAWKNYVYERFGKGGPSQLRQRRLVLELSQVTDREGWVPWDEVSELTPRADPAL